MIPAANKDFVLKTLNIYDTRALKKYGQNFLIDNQIAKEIVDEVKSNSTTTVVEIGPGLGALSYHLIQKEGKKILVDIDEVMVFHLNKYINDDNVSIIKNDILKFDLNKIATDIVIVGNLPYYITTEIIEKCVKCNKIIQMTMMVQKEAYYRLVAQQGSKEYSPISIFIEYLGGSKVIKKISRHAYIPEPHVDSLVFQINVNKKRIANDEELFFKVAKAMFLMRRKTILNNLTTYLKDKDKAAAVLQELNCEFTNRPEQLSLEFYLDLADLLAKQKQ